MHISPKTEDSMILLARRAASLPPSECTTHLSGRMATFNDLWAGWIRPR